MTILLAPAVAGFVVATIVAPYVDARRRRRTGRVRFTESARIAPRRVVRASTDTHGPRFTRDDPSPSPRRKAS